MADSGKTNNSAFVKCMRCLLPYVLLAVAYIVSGKLGLMLALPPGYASPIFPPAGIAVAAVLIGGKKAWPWIFLGSLLLNLWAGYTASHQMDSVAVMGATAIALASTLQAATGGWMLHRAIGYPAALDRGSQIMRFLLLAPVLSLVSSTISVTSLWALGNIDQAQLAMNWATWWVGDSLGVVVMVPIVMTVAGQPRDIWRSRMRTVATPMLLIFALFVVIYLKTNQWEYHNSLSDFSQMSQQAFDQVNIKLEEQSALLDEMAGLLLHDEHGHLGRDEFHRALQRVRGRFPMIQALEWVPRVDAGDRERFEAGQRADLPGFEITERSDAGKLVRAGHRASYYPVTYVEPLTGNEPAVGFDLASNAARREALDKAVRTGTAVMTEGVHLVQDAQSQSGVLILLAVHPHDSGTGMVLTVLKMGDFMDKLLSGTRPLLYTRLIDLDENRVLYDNFSPGAGVALRKRDFTFGTRHYELENAPTPAYFAQHHGWESWGVLAMGILGTGLIGALLLLGTGYAGRVEAQVRDRTRELSESESRFHFILENSPIAVRITAFDSGKVIFVNQGYADLIAIAADKAIGIDPGQFYVNPAVYDEIRQQVGNGGRITNKLVELRVPTEFSDTKWVLASYLSLEFEEERGILGWFYDITERKRAEEALADSEEKLRELYELSPLGIALTDMNGRYVEFNDAFRLISGYGKEELIGLDYWALTPKKYEAEEAKQLASLSSTGHYGPYEKEYIRKDGSMVPLRLSGVLVTGRDGQKYIWSIVEDISERKRSEENLRITASVFENTQEGILITDNKNLIIGVNAAFTRITGYAEEDVFGLDPKMLSSGQQDKAYYAEMWQSLNEKGIWRGEIWNRRKSGEALAEMLSISVIRDDARQVKRYVGVFSDITNIKKHEAELSRIAHYDALTGIPNRVLLADRMKQAVAQTTRNNNILAVCYLDLDGFKAVNDSMGHEVGDLVLIALASRIESALRGGDTVARLGGDEFVVLLLGLEKVNECLVTLERLLREIDRPVSVRGATLTLSASIGVTFYPDDNEEPDTLMRHADQAMYLAKQSGKNRFHIYDPEKDLRARDQHEFLKSIQRGIEESQFELYYQPKVNLRTKEMVGAEALIRWNHPERGLLYPAEFLRMVENTDLDIEIGVWVIQTALKQLENWRQQGLDIEISINLSAFHLESSSFTEKLKQEIALYPAMSSGTLQIEVLETSALADVNRMNSIIEECRTLGVRFALDDFGTGYSSLTYLSNLPVDVLKVDQSFVRDMLDDQGDLVIVQGIIALAKAFNRQTVAEGIETMDHYRVLLDMGCEVGQGYGIARPMPSDKLKSWKME